MNNYDTMFENMNQEYNFWMVLKTIMITYRPKNQKELWALFQNDRLGKGMDQEWAMLKIYKL